MNAGTSNDFTVYFINVPSNKLELWFWMESDRLANPVFREFYSERDVVREERRLRTESTPTGQVPGGVRGDVLESPRPTTGRWWAGRATWRTSRARRRSPTST